MIGGIIGELDGHLVAVDKVDDSGHELGAPTMIFRSIIQVESERRDGGKTLLDGLPTVAEAIDQAIARDLIDKIYKSHTMEVCTDNEKN
jgi:hypothetical protein